MIKKPDGTPYLVLGSRQQFDPESPLHDLFNLWDEQAIRIGGSPIFYQEVFIPPASIDPVYWESRDKVWTQDPVQLYCFYEPIPSQNLMGNFGFDSPDEMIFELNYRAVLKTIGHPPRIGSKLFTPHKREFWEIIQRNLGEWKMWGELRIQLITKRWQDNATDPSSLGTTKEPDFKLNEGRLLK